jgi:hypothetical protein
MPRIARFWDALPRFGQPPSCKQPGMCSENSGLCQAISELVQRSGKALRHGLEPRLESLALRLGRIDWKPARCELRAALVLGESADTGRVSATLPQSDKGRVARHTSGGRSQTWLNSSRLGSADAQPRRVHGFGGWNSGRPNCHSRKLQESAKRSLYWSAPLPPP